MGPTTLLKRPIEPAPRIGVALGSGSARGWAHIGVLQELEAAGIRPQVICGTSVGALVGAVAAAGRLDALAGWATGLEWWDIVRYVVEPGSGGLVDGERLMRAYAEQVGEPMVESLPITFAAVAAELNSGREVWLRQGPLIDVVRASIALPGVFSPVRRDGAWLVDGGLVDPVPVSVCRALGAELVIAVNLNHLLAGRQARARKRDDSRSRVLLELGERLQSLRFGGPGLLAKLQQSEAGPESAPSMFEVMAGALNIMQDRITRSRMAGDPPDVTVAPRLDQLALFDFDRAGDAIAEGRAAMRRALPGLLELHPGLIGPQQSAPQLTQSDES